MVRTFDIPFRKALITSIPVMTGYLFLGFGFGVLLRQAGYGVWWALVMSITMYAGAMQYLAIELITGGAGLVTVALTTLMVNARHLFYGISLVEKYRDAGWRKPFLAFTLTDETYSLITRIPARVNGKSQRNFFLLLSVMNHCYWITGCVLGDAVGDSLPFNTQGIDFVLTALFLTIVTDQWLQSKRGHVPATIGAGSALVCLAIFGPDNFLIPTMIVILVGLLAGRRGLEVVHG